jgi:hypothetical protein
MAFITAAVGKAATTVARYGIDRLSPGRRLDESITAAHQEMSLIGYRVARLFAAGLLGKAPTDQEVDQFLESAIHDPSFPARYARLWLEATKSPSEDRRYMLTARLLAPRLQGDQDQELRDRVDAAFERMFVGDVELLLELEALQGVDHEQVGVLLHEGVQVAVLRGGIDRGSGEIPDRRVACHPYALGNLEAVSLARLHEFIGMTALEGRGVASLELTPLGLAIAAEAKRLRAGLVAGASIDEPDARASR